MDAKQNNAMLEQIISLLPNHIYWKDCNGVYKFCNDQQAKTLGYKTGKEIVGLTDHDLPWKKQVKQLHKVDQEVIRTGNTHTIEEKLSLPKGQKVIFLSNKVPLYDDNGKIIGILGVSVDITELKAAKEKAEEINKLQASFIRDMEHDIRTPFSGILGAANLLIDKESDKAKKEYLGYIITSTKELLNYLNEILEFSNVGNNPVIHRKFNLKETVNNILMIERAAAESKKLLLSLNYAPKQSFFIGDKKRLSRILLNLVSNAIKFTVKGAVNIDVKLLKKEAKSALLQITVRDTGEGISAHVQNVMFEKFSRGTPAGQGLYKGLGLGLSIVKQYITDLGGELDIESEQAIGTKVICTIPLCLPLLDN